MATRKRSNSPVYRKFDRRLARQAKRRLRDANDRTISSSKLRRRLGLAK